MQMFYQNLHIKSLSRDHLHHLNIFYKIVDWIIRIQYLC